MPSPRSWTSPSFRWIGSGGCRARPSWSAATGSWRSGPTARVKVPEGGARVDGRGKFLIPGLAEMHAHIPGGQATRQRRGADAVPLRRGRDHHDPRHAGPSAPPGAARRGRRADELLSPTIYAAGPSFNGNSVPDPRGGREGGDRAEGGGVRPAQDPSGREPRGVRYAGGDRAAGGHSASPGTCRRTSASPARSRRGTRRSSTSTATSRRCCATARRSTPAAVGLLRSQPGRAAGRVEAAGAGRGDEAGRACGTCRPRC